MPAARPIADGLFIVDGTGPRLCASRCDACRSLQFPAAPACPYCGASGSTPTLVGPRGTLRLFTAVSSRPPGYRGPVPFGFGVVELEGAELQVITRLTESDPARLGPGCPMNLVVVPVGEDDDGTRVLTWAFSPGDTP